MDEYGVTDGGDQSFSFLQTTAFLFMNVDSASLSPGSSPELGSDLQQAGNGDPVEEIEGLDFAYMEASVALLYQWNYI